MERLWKPHLENLDTEHAKLLHQLSQKKEVLGELEREIRSWETRISPVKDPEQIQDKKKTLGLVKVSTKLREQIQELKEAEAEKKKKKVDERKLQAEFAKSLAKSANAGGKDKKEKQKEK